MSTQATTDSPAWWCAHVLPQFLRRLGQPDLQRPSFYTDQDVADLAAVTRELLGSRRDSWSRMLDWREGRATIIGRHAERIDDEAVPTLAGWDAVALPMAIIECAWHRQGRPDLWMWDRWDPDNGFGGDAASQAAFRALVVGCRAVAGDKSGPRELAFEYVEGVEDAPRFLWAF